MHDALGTQSTDELQNILTGLCNSVITEEDCKKQIIQDALNVSCDEELNDVMSKITGDFSPEKKSDDTVEKSEVEYPKKDEENISDQPHFSLQLKDSSSDDDEFTAITQRSIIEISDSDEDAESIMVIYYNLYIFKKIILLNNNKTV